MKKLIVLLGFLLLLPAQARPEFLPSIEDTLIIKDWLYAGPFSVGAKEGIVDVIRDTTGFVPREGETVPSILAPGGKVKWKRIESQDGSLKLKYDDIDWDNLQDIYGVAGLLDAGYAYAEFSSPDRRRALAMAEKVSWFKLNNEHFPGGPYGHDIVRIPVILSPGKNRVLVKVGGFTDHRFTFKLIPAPSPVVILTKDATLPDIIKGQALNSPVGIAILNTTSRWLKGLKLSLGGEGPFLKTERIVPAMAPLSVIKVPIDLKLRKPITEGDTISVPVSVASEGFIYRRRLKLRLREKGGSYKVTFISKIDSSCQYYAVLPPQDYDPKRNYALIFTLHGAGVRASGQVDAYTQKDWAFVVAPTNRRRFGFDWQDWGRLDALEVLDKVKKRFPIDPNRIYLTGHSMGGHGVWHIGLAHSDLFAAMVSSAGWTSFQLYIPWFLQKSYLFAHPQLLAYRDMSLREDIPPLFLDNALNLPIFILQGEADDNVPPIQARLYAKLLHQLGYEFTYREVPGQKHWWDLKDTPGTDCVDSDELMGFLQFKRKNPFPKHLIFKTSDIGLNNKCYWLEIERVEQPFADSRVEAEVRGRKIEIKAKNIAEFSLNLSPKLLPLGKIGISVNFQPIGYNFRRPVKLFISQKKGRFSLGKLKGKGLKKTAQLFGPIKRAYFSPFLLVYGTLGDSASVQRNLHLARLQAFSWWRRANGLTRIISDREVTDEIIKDYNLILFGSPEENLIVKRINKKLPLSIKGERIYMGDKPIAGEDLALEEVYPNPLNPQKLVLVFAGANKQADEISGFFNTLYSGAGLPDFVVYDKSVKQKGWGGVVTAGFFSTDWNLKGGNFFR